jgi:hypothetical protein
MSPSSMRWDQSPLSSKSFGCFEYSFTFRGGWWEPGLGNFGVLGAGDVDGSGCFGGRVASTLHLAYSRAVDKYTSLWKGLHGG